MATARRAPQGGRAHAAGGARRNGAGGKRRSEVRRPAATEDVADAPAGGAEADGDGGEDASPFLEIFARSQTPVGRMARAQASLAATEAAMRQWEDGSNVAEKPVDSFWEWVPPGEDDGGDRALSGTAATTSASTSTFTTEHVEADAPSHTGVTLPQLGEAFKAFKESKVPAAREFAVAEPREVPEALADLFAPKPLELAFASDATRQASVAAAAADAAPAVPEVKVGLQVATDDADDAEEASRTWTETWTETLSNGAIKVVTRVRGTTADGSVEFEETTWEASDAFGFKQLGALKLGRTSSGAAWRQSWCETLDFDTASGVAGAMKVHREAEKWGSAGAEGREWYETWRQTDFSDGRCERSAYKWGRLAHDEYPDPGHAREWHEKWGEEWPAESAAAGNAKWCDRWAMDGGNKWGESWEERHGAAYAPDGLASRRMGESWSVDGYRKTWGEEWFEGGVHKFGGDTNGDGWDVVEGAGEMPWFEGRPHHGGWHGALNHSPQLLTVPKRGDRIRSGGVGGGGWGAL